LLSRFARVVEGIFGASASTAAAMLETVATILLVATVALALARAVIALRAWRHGWETGLVVRCRQCARLAADPDHPVCPAGHPVRFPPLAARREELRRRIFRWRRAAMAYPIVLSGAIAVLAGVGFGALRVGRLRSPLAAMAASLAFYFCVALLYAAWQALSSEWLGWPSRLLHAGLAVILAIPLLFLGSLSRAFEPVETRVLGHLWSTPTAVYLSTGGRARRVAPAAARAEALLIEARAPAAGIVWQGIKGIRVGDAEVAWRGSGGRTARWLDRWAEEDGSSGLLVRRAVAVDVPPNVRVRILREGDAIRLVAER